MNFKQIITGLFVSSMLLASAYAVVNSPISSITKTQSGTGNIIQLDSNITI